MKKLIFIISILILSVTSFGQDVVGSRVIAKQSLFVRDRWVDTVTVDTNYFRNYNRSVPTAGAVYSFLLGRIPTGAGTGSVTNVGSGYGLTGGPITTSGTLVFDSATVFPQLRATISAGSGTVTSLSQGYGIINTPNPITTTGTVKFDSATVFPQVRSTIFQRFGKSGEDATIGQNRFADFQNLYLFEATNTKGFFFENDYNDGGTAVNGWLDWDPSFAEMYLARGSAQQLISFSPNVAGTKAEILIRAKATGAFNISAITIRNDSIVIDGQDGQIEIESLRMANSDTAGYKPMVWNINNKSWRYFNSWGELGFQGALAFPYTANKYLTGYNTFGSFRIDSLVGLTSNSIYYVNNSGVITALPLGSSGKVLTTNGATSAPTWETPASGSQTLASTSDATSHTVTLSNSGGSFKLVEGSNITLTTSGTGLDGIITIASTGGGGSSTWNGITDPTGDQALTFQVGESSTWTDQNTTEDLFTVNNATSTTNSLFSYNRTSTALAAGNNIMELVSSGINGTNAITATGLLISVTNTNGTSGTNNALTLTASGATTANNAINITAGTIKTIAGSSSVRALDMGDIGIYNFGSTDIGIYAGTIQRAFIGQSGFAVRDASTAIIDLGSAGLGGTNSWRLTGATVGTMKVATTGATAAVGIQLSGGEGAVGFVDIYADEGDDAADKWRIESQIDNDIAIINNTTEYVNITSAGAVTLPNLAGTGSRTVLTDANGLLSAPVSDRSVKKNIQQLNYGLSTIMQLNPVSFEYKDGWKNYGQGTQIGFIAQDVQQVLPNSVFTTPSTGKMGYSEIDIVPILVKGMQEQQHQIEELKKEIKKLKHK